MPNPTSRSFGQLLARYPKNAPRYTSYPPANFFRQNPGAIKAEEMIRDSNHIGARNLGFYFHIPFCPKRCLFCGCNTEIGRGAGFIADYLQTLSLELDRLTPLLDPSRPVTQVHFGGGTPNAIPLYNLSNLLVTLGERFSMAPDAEVAIECEPNLLTEAKLVELRQMGFNRVSYGLQDFNTEVLAAVNRRLPKMHPKQLVAFSRELGFHGINLDLIYGLPKQTEQSFRESISQLLEARPDRISLFPYAHVPWMKEHQSKLEILNFPTPDERLIMAAESREALISAGYTPIGMDHFALPDDELSRALANGTLHRNFQGYCPGQKAGQIVALGASAISQLHAGYLQNTRDTQHYINTLKSGNMPWEGAYRLTEEDQLVRGIIQDILCRNTVDLSEHFSKSTLTPLWLRNYRIESFSRLEPFLSDHLIEIQDESLNILPEGRPLARIIATAFDPLLRSESSEMRYSQAV